MAVPEREKQLGKKPAIRKKLLKLQKDIAKGFENQNERSDNNMDYWDLYNSSLSYKQFYNGNSQVFVPIVNDAVTARTTRFSNQLFPQNGRYVEVTSESGDIPYAHMALLEHYVDKNHLREFVKALLVQGDVEGQYSIYVDWQEITRNVVFKTKRGIKVSGIENEDLGDYEDMEEEELKVGRPCVEIIPDNDLLIFPVNVDTIEQALEEGGGIAILRRFTKAKIQQLIDDKEFEKEAGESFLREMGQAKQDGAKNTKKALATDAGIKIEGKQTYALCYEVWTKLKVADEYRICKTYLGGIDNILGCKINPYWCDRVPVISAPVKKLGNIFKGVSPIKKVASLQYAANDFINEAFDSASFSMMPIVMTDPEKNPNVDNMLIAVGAIWNTNPKDTSFAQFPQLWKEAITIVSGIKEQIFQSLSVNPAMMPNSTSTKKKNQAEIANEQAVDLLTTADAVTSLEQQVLTPLLERFFEYDHQFRKEDISIEMYGEMGLKAKMETVTPVQMEERYKFRWFGVEAARSAQMIQQQVAGMNVLRGIPPEMYKGKTLDLTPLIENLVENTYGPHLAPRIFKDERSQLSIDPKIENEMLSNDLPVRVQASDNDIEHIKAHMEVLKQGDESGFIRVHIQEHQQQLSHKQELMAMQKIAEQQQKGSPGAPGQPGLPGTPKPGSQPQAPGGMKAPPGSISPDQMKDASKMPRHM